MRTYTEESKKNSGVDIANKRSSDTNLISLQNKRYTEVYRGKIRSLICDEESIDNYYKSIKDDSDYKQLSHLYYEIINRFIDVTREIGFKHPLEIFAAFTYLLKKGYLSKNMKFDDSNETFNDNYLPICGINIIDGKGVCRHTTQMLDSIYKRMNIKATQLHAKQISIFNNEGNSDGEKESKSQLYRETSDFPPENMTNYLKLLLICLKEDINGIFKNTSPNHVVNYVVYEGKSYYLDPTNYCFLTKIPVRKNLFINSNCTITQMARGNRVIYNNFKNIRRINKEGSSIPSSLEQNIPLVTNTRKICEENEELLERFYQNNSSIYDEIGLILSR